MNLTKNKIDVATPYSLLRVNLNPLTLAFTGNNKALEADFLDAYFSNSLDHLRRCKLYAILFFSIFGVLDAFVFPQYKYQLWFIRYALVCPVFIFGLIFSYTKFYRRLWQPINALYIMVTGYAYVVMVVITPTPESYFYGVGTIFCIFFGYTFIHARFITASIAGTLVIGGYQVIMMRLMDVSTMIQLISGAHFLGINLLGMIICYSIESQQRKNFFLTYLLEKEKEKTEDTNRSLEKRVEARTEALQRINRDLNKEVLERKQAEQRVRASRERFETILDSIDADIYVTDIETRTVLLANQHMKQTFGEDIVGKRCHESIAHRETPCEQCHTDLLLDDGGRPAEHISWEEKNPVTGRWYIIYSRAIVWEDGRLVQLQVATDVTAMKEIETRLQRAQKMEAIGTLAGGVAHDLNNILSGLVGYPELLLMDTFEGSETHTMINTIKKSGEKAAAIVQDMLTLARRGVAVADIVSLNSVVEDYLSSPELDRLKSLHPQMTIRQDLAPVVFNIVGSAVHLGKTIMNLVTNAAEAMPRGGVITLSTQNVYLDRTMLGFETVPEGEYVKLRVTDTGVGIAASDLECIFEPFYTKKKMGRSGTGLGMAVVWGTVKDHNGFIDASSIEGRGTAFDLYFPVTRQDMEKETADLPIDQYCGNGERVLVVDDIIEQRELAALMLKRLNYRVDTVANGEEAVNYLRKHPVDILVLDMILDATMDGLDTYRKILTISPGQKAIIASGFSESERVLEAQRLGAGRYIKKPYRMEQIGLALREQLSSESPGDLLETSVKG
jgi:two-component system cell cycle sensor histidine kinase/response regulator CckA